MTESKCCASESMQQRPDGRGPVCRECAQLKNSNSSGRRYVYRFEAACRCEAGSTSCSDDRLGAVVHLCRLDPMYTRLRAARLHRQGGAPTTCRDRSVRTTTAALQRCSQRSGDAQREPCPVFTASCLLSHTNSNVGRNAPALSGDSREGKPVPATSGNDLQNLTPNDDLCLWLTVASNAPNRQWKYEHASTDPNF
jgi:hypothetical protein